MGDESMERWMDGWCLDIEGEILLAQGPDTKAVFRKGVKSIIM